MNSNDFFFKKMCAEALEDLTSGKYGTWREIPTNTLFLAVVGIVHNSLTHKIVTPLRWIAGCTGAAVITYVVMSILSID